MCVSAICYEHSFIEDPDAILQAKTGHFFFIELDIVVIRGCSGYCFRKTRSYSKGLVRKKRRYCVNPMVLAG